MPSSLQFTILGLSITSSWGNGHATTYRGLVRALCERGHHVTFLERDVPWYADNRDLPHPPWGTTHLYSTLDELQDRYAASIREADVVIVGSYVPEGIAVGKWVTQIARGTTAFYDIDTPVTIAALQRGDCDYVSPELIQAYQLYLSFTGGPTLRTLETDFGSPKARPLYCAVDAQHYQPVSVPVKYDLGYLGTYSADRQPPLERLMLAAARRWPEGRFAVAGPQYPETIDWPANVERVDHLPPADHAAFYCAQRYTMNITRADMIRAGYSPSVRLFEAAACGVPIISDAWSGLEAFFVPGREILISRSAEETAHILRSLPEQERRAIAEAARQKVLQEHTAFRRAEQLEEAIRETALASRRGRISKFAPTEHRLTAAERSTNL